MIALVVRRVRVVLAGTTMNDTTKPKADGSRVGIRSELMAEMICATVSAGGTVAAACRDYGISRSALYEWIADDVDFRQRMETARKVGFDAIADEAFSILDDLTENPRSRAVRFDGRMKLLAKWHPKAYGERVQVETTNRTAQVTISDDPVEAARQYQELIAGT